MKGTIYEQVEKSIRKNLTFKRGDIILADLDGVGSEQKGVRPVLIMQNDSRNETSNTLIIVCLTSKEKRLDLKCHVKLFDGSVALCEQIRTIDKSRIKGFVDMLDSEQMKEVDNSLKIALGVKND